MENTSGYLTRVEAAAYANVHPRTITRWISEGHLTKTPGRRGRYPIALIKVDELKRLITPTPIGNDDRA